MGILPTEWIEKVVAILDAGRAGTRAITNTARLDWMALFPDSSKDEVYLYTVVEREHVPLEFHVKIPSSSWVGLSLNFRNAR